MLLLQKRLAAVRDRVDLTSQPGPSRAEAVPATYNSPLASFTPSSYTGQRRAARLQPLTWEDSDDDMDTSTVRPRLPVSGLEDSDSDDFLDSNAALPAPLESPPAARKRGKSPAKGPGPDASPAKKGRLTKKSASTPAKVTRSKAVGNASLLADDAGFADTLARTLATMPLAAEASKKIKEILDAEKLRHL